MAAEQWERRQGLWMRDVWSWYTWQPCTEAEARRVTGLRSWQVRQYERCSCCAGTGRAPLGMTAWQPAPLEDIRNCLDNSLKHAAELLRATGNAGDAIDAKRLEYQRELNRAAASVGGLGDGAECRVEAAIEKLRRCQLGCGPFGQCKAAMQGVPSECAAGVTASQAGQEKEGRD